MKRLLQLFVAISLIFLLIKNIDLRALTDAFMKFRWQSIAVAIALFFISCGVAASKWRLLWCKATWREMLLANFVSQFYSVVLPGQLAGEAVKAYRVGRRFSDTTGVAASVLVDRVTGLVGLLMLATVGTILSVSPVARVAMQSLLVATACFVCVLYIITLPFVFSAVTVFLARIAERHSWLNGASKAMVALVTAWAALVSGPRTTFVAVALGIVFQVICVCINLIMASDLGIGVAFSDWCWILGLVSVAVLLPITVAGVGVREGAYAGSLSLLGVPIEKAIALSLAVFAISLVGALIGAIVELSSLRDRRAQTR